MKRTISGAEARDRFDEAVRLVVEERPQVVVEREGTPAVVILSADDCEWTFSGRCGRKGMRNSSTIRVEAGCIVRLMAGVTNEQAEVERLLDGWSRSRRRIVVPLLLRYETTNALHLLKLAGERTASAIQISLRAALALPIEFHAEPPLPAAAVTWAERFGLPAAYDAHYLALADRLGAEFWTTDRRLANKVRPTLPRVRLVGE